MAGPNSGEVGGIEKQPVLDIAGSHCEADRARRGRVELEKK
jgi:hypothetical protein